MIITLRGANFSSNNINDMLNSYFITVQGSNLTHNLVDSVNKETNSGVSGTITINDGYVYDDSRTLVVKMGTQTLSGVANIAEDGKSITINISQKITGNVVITVPTKSVGGGEPGNDDVLTLDSIAYGGKTYREVFANGNKITTGNMITDNSIDSWAQYSSVPKPTVTTTYYNTPSSAIDASCTSSAQAYIDLPDDLISGHQYYAACKRMLTAWTQSTWCGFQLTDASNSDELIIERAFCNDTTITDEFVTLSKIHTMDKTYSNARYWIGCGGSAKLNAYIDDFMLVDLTEVFGSNIPTESEMDALYDNFLSIYGATSSQEPKPASLDDIAHGNISYRALFLDNNELNDMDMIDNDTINLIQYQTYPLPMVDNSVYNTPSVSMNITGTKSVQGYKECDISTNHNYFIGFNRNITSKTAGSRAGIWFTEEGQTGGTNASAEKLAVTNGWEARTSIYQYTGTKTKGMIWVGSGGGANLTGHIDDLVFIDLTKVFGDNIPTNAKMKQLYNNFVELCKNA